MKRSFSVESILIILGIVILVIHTLRGTISLIVPSDLKAYPGIPIVTEDPIRHEQLSIDQIVHSSDMIYILYDHYCVVSAFTHEGEYAYTISAYSHNNGSAHIRVVDEKLYLMDKRQNLYRFSGKEFLSYTPKEKLSPYEKSLDFTQQSARFVLKGSSIYEVRPTGETTLTVKRPAILWLFQDMPRLWSTLLLISCHAVLILVYQKPEKKGNLKPHKTGQDRGRFGVF